MHLRRVLGYSAPGTFDCFKGRRALLLIALRLWQVSGVGERKGYRMKEPTGTDPSIPWHNHERWALSKKSDTRIQVLLGAEHYTLTWDELVHKSPVLNSTDN